MHIAPRKVFLPINRIIAEGFHRFELFYTLIRISKAVNEIDKVHMGVCDNLYS